MLKNKRTIPILLALLLVLVTATAVFAVFVTINTNDGVLDADWNTTLSFYFPNVTDPNEAGVTDTVDIRYGGVATNGNTTPASDVLAFVLGVEPGNIALTGANEAAAVIIDCDNDNPNGAAPAIPGDANDLIVLYNPTADAVQVRNANTFVVEGTMPATAGERTTTPDQSAVEWLVLKSVLTASATTCPNATNSSGISIAFATVDTTVFPPTILDFTNTSAADWNSATAVSLQGISAQNGQVGPVLLVIAAALLLLTGFVFWRRQQS